MTLTIESADLYAFEAVVRHLQAAWNNGDGVGFAAPFSEDADFVNIFGMHARGRNAIAAGHQQILHTVYAGSTLRTQLKQARLIAWNVALLHLSSRLQVPSGPLAGEMTSLPSVVMEHAESGWQIVAFHNTLVQSPPLEHNNGQVAALTVSRS